MRMKLRLRQKILLLVLSVTLVIYALSIVFIASSDRNVMLTDSREKVRLYASKAAGVVQTRMARYAGLTEGLAQAFSDYYKRPPAEWQAEYLSMLHSVFIASPEISSLWDSWEYYAYVPNYKKSYGRLARQLWRERDGSVQVAYRELSLMGDPQPYKAFKEENRSDFWEPYRDEMSNNRQKGVLMTTVASPIRRDGRYVGVVACDVELAWFKQTVNSVKPFVESEAFLVSSTGLIIAHPCDSLLCRNIEDILPEVAQNEGITRKIPQGDELSFIHVDQAGMSYFVYMVPVKVEGIRSKWSLGVQVPLHVITESADGSIRLSLMALLLSVVLLVGLLVAIANGITRPVRRVTELLNLLGQGDLERGEELHVTSGDELEEMARSAEVLMQGLRAKSESAQRIGAGDLRKDIPLLSENDTLGHSLQLMQENLRRAAEEEKLRREEMLQRTWINNGIGEVSKIIRDCTGHLDALCEGLLRYVVRYLEADQGAMYLPIEEGADARTADGRRRYRLTSAFAWGRCRYLTSEVAEGEGFVGACAMERQALYITDVPKDYSTIPAGVGDALPRCLVFIPYVHEGSVVGVAEFASFKMLQRFELDFLEQMAPMVAAGIFSVRVEGQTRALLLRSQEQTELLRSQEEELRQNLEELQAVQEDASRQREAMENYVSAIKDVMNYAEYDVQGKVIAIGDQRLFAAGRTRDQELGSFFYQGIKVEGWGVPEFEDFWKSMLAGKGGWLRAEAEEFGQRVQVWEVYIPIRRSNGTVERVVKFSHAV